MVEEGASQTLKPAMGEGRTYKAPGPAFRTYVSFSPESTWAPTPRQLKYNH